MKNSIKIGDQVKVLNLNRRGRVVAVSGKNSFKVLIGDLQMYCKASELEFLSTAPKPSTVFGKGISFQKPKVKAPKSLDLHGHNSEAAKEALIKFISDAVMAGHQQVSIIHGHGTGIIKNLVHATLSKMEVVASFRHPMGNTAETKVYFE